MPSSNAERETHFNICADDRQTCHIFTDDPVWINRLLQWFEPVRQTGDGYEFSVPTKYVIRESTMRNGTDALRRFTNRDVENIGQSKLSV